MSRAILGRPMKVTGRPATFQAPPMKQPTEPAPRTATLSPATVWSDALIGQPQPLRRFARLPEDIDRHSAARVPIAADAQPLRLHLGHQPLPDPHGHVFMEAAMVPVRSEKQLEALALDDCLGRRIVDDEVREVRL